jgi:hypothetical protein
MNLETAVEHQFSDRLLIVQVLEMRARVGWGREPWSPDM